MNCGIKSMKLKVKALSNIKIYILKWEEKVWIENISAV